MIPRPTDYDCVVSWFVSIYIYHESSLSEIPLRQKLVVPAVGLSSYFVGILGHFFFRSTYPGPTKGLPARLVTRDKSSGETNT